MTNAIQDEMDFSSELEVIQYALTLEHLESAFYRDALTMFDDAAFMVAGYQSSVREKLQMIADHEASHVETLTSVVTTLGGDPVTEGTYDFGYTDLASFLATAAAIENTGVGAYTGAARYLIEDDNLLTAALTIHGVEARHASYLNLVTGAVPFPANFDQPLSKDEVLAIAGPMIVS